jgi:iron complex outermembrane receptor protein
MFSADAVRGKTAKPLNGSYTPDQAVRALLAGSGLIAEYRKDVILIRGRSVPSGEVGDSSADQTDIVITGSYIRGTPASSPVTRASRSDIERLGLADLATFSRGLPQNFSGGQNPGIIGGGGGNENVNSSSALNLRGLGPDATLTLINGHRIAYDAAAQGVDISAIPLAAIDRVEVVMDGTSALYGSDAIGGVANIILRRDFGGLQTSARFGAATDGGYAQRQFTAVGGGNWSNGGIVLTGDYSYSSPILAGQRSYTQTLDRSATLFPKLRQISAVVAGHQRLGEGLELEFDGQFNDRRSGLSSPSTTIADARTNGVLSDYGVRSYSLTPRLRLALPADWELTVSVTHGMSETDNELANYVQGREAARSRVAYHNKLTAVEASAAGSVFTAPGGDTRLAVGAGYRSIHLYGNIRTISGGVAGTSSQDFSAGRDAFYGFAETAIPIVGPRNGARFVTALLLTGALRYEEYRGIGGVTTPKLGLVYQPSADLSIKASWGKSFKAPTLYQQFSARQGFLLPGFIYPGVIPTGKQVLLLGGGSDSLRPETARTWTAGLALHPRALEGLRIEASYFDVHYRDRIVQPLVNLLAAFSTDAYAPLRVLNPTTEQVLAAVARLTTGITNQSGGQYVPANVAAILDNRNRNAATQDVRGVDLGFTYTRSITPADRIDMSFAATYLESDQRLSDGQPMIQRAGIVLNLPHWRGRGSATWTHGGLSLTGVANHIGGTLDNRFAPFVEVGSFTAFDAIGQLRSGENGGPLAGVDLSLSVLNLFNRKPASIRTTSAVSPTFDSANYPSIGRSISLTITKRW